jgi:hypothetical protein
MMPRQGQSVESCIITEWKKKVGDAVQVGDILFSYETDKSTFEEAAKTDGTLLAVFFNADDDVPVLTNVAVIGNPGESFAEFAPGGAAPAKAEQAAAPAAVEEAKPAAQATAAGEEDDDIVFSDVATDAWYYDAVRFVVSLGLFEGTGGGRFSPEAAMTRAMLVTVLYRLEGSPAVSGTNPFADVEDGQWYTDAVVWANQNGIVTGYGDGLFGTNDNITREQLAAILYRYAEYKGYDVSAAADLAGYSDAGSVSSWAEAAMRWASAEGLITGVTATSLSPSGNATRAQVAMILMRFVNSVIG